MPSLLQHLRTRFDRALVAAFGAELAGTDPLVVPASNPKFGDYQANIAMSLAKPLKQKPRDIAAKIIENLDIADLCQEPEIAGPGFINLRLDRSFLETQLQAIQSDDRLGVETATPPQRVVIDFSSPNIAKEMHVGHLRSTIIGDSIARTLEFLGHDVLRLNHVGDWGTQFGMLITYLSEVYPQALADPNSVEMGDLVAFYKQAKQRFDEDEGFRESSRQAVVRLQAGEEREMQAWKLLCDRSRREFQEIYDWLDIKLAERGESFYNSLLIDVVSELDEKGLLAESEGAICVFLEGFTNKEGNPLPLIVQKSDGGFNYATTDLAALRYRVRQDGGDRLIYVVDMGQNTHLTQVFQVAAKAGWLTAEKEAIHVQFGLVLDEKGKKFKTRSGETVRLRDLLDEAVDRARKDLEKRLQEDDRTESAEFIDRVAKVVGISAVKYADLSQNRTSNYIFSYDKMLDLKGNTAPYLLYAYARVRSIERKGNVDLDAMKAGQVILSEEEERAIAKHILSFTDVLREVESELMPNRLCSYLYELSQKFNQFYDRCPVLTAPEPSRTSRLILCDLSARTLKLGLSLLGIEVLERM